jgi:hypothetical protein
MYNESFTMQNFIYKVLRRKIFSYKLDLLEKIKYLYGNFNAIKSIGQKFERKERVKKNIYKNYTN